MPLLNSTASASAEYDRRTQILSVRFRETGKLYFYHNVPEAVYHGLIGAASAGQFFNECIRDHYRFTQQAA